MLKNLNNKFGKVNAVLANEYIKVYPETAEEHRDMQKFCREEKIVFYVIRPLSERPFKIVMKGLHRDTDIEEITSELAIALPEIEILKVGQLKNVRTKAPMDIFMIELKKNGHENKIFVLTHFMFLKIKIQNYRKPPGATQCWNCNMLNHSSANCGFQTRCLKCGEDHRTNHDPAGKPQVYKLRSNWSYCLMERLPIISKNQTNERPRCKLPKSAKRIPSFSIQETGKYILLNANTKVNTPAGRTQLASGKRI
ncbi:hypothetical protein AVEN_183644-1 [Araneus ventricosus]|uniref:Pre-C2HC domain-containing protein n=1 Tax=Araneus ventricosus TaxID=182803 RepID=A0A4Y2H6Q5_ARAVE|nr:hypothetical protein AVEN_183644-1 [Araneus ventricosus]